MKLMFLGDTHADPFFARRAFVHASEGGADAIVQCGDFGWWPSFAAPFTHRVSAMTEEYGIPLHWVDGNHEDHTALPHRSSEPEELLPGVIYHPRGTRSQLGKKSFLWLGGAISIDRDHRTAGRDWFPNEAPSLAELERAVEGGSVDIVVAHDAPAGVEIPSGYPFYIPPETKAAADACRGELRQVCEAVTPQLWIHGHWHTRQTQKLGETTVETLADNRRGLNKAVFWLEV